MWLWKVGGPFLSALLTALLEVESPQYVLSTFHFVLLLQPVSSFHVLALAPGLLLCQPWVLLSWWHGAGICVSAMFPKSVC